MPPSPPTEPSVLFPQIVMFGDSITQGSFAEGGTGAALSDLYQRVFDVQNRGLAGYNTAWAMPILKTWLPKIGEDRPPIALMTIWFGANDAALPTSVQHIPLTVFKWNLHKIIALLTSPSSPHYSPTTKIVLITPPAFNPPAWDEELKSRGVILTEPERNAESPKVYAEAVKEVAREARLPVVDAHSSMTAAAEKEGGDLSSFLYDGLHLTGKGYKVVTEELKRVITTDLPDLHWDSFKRTYPHWSEIPDGALGPEFEVKKKAQ